MKNDRKKLKEKKNSTKMELGIVLIILGVLTFMEKYHFFNFDWERVVFSWQMFVIVIGAIIYGRTKKDFTGVVLMAIGGIFLVKEFIDLPFDKVLDYWPFVLVVLGFIILFKKDKKNIYKASKGAFYNENYFYISSFFKKRKEIFAVEEFKGAKITNIFGTSHIDISGSTLSYGSTIIDVFTLFGKFKITVSPNYKVVTDMSSLFGKVYDKRTKPESEAYPIDKILVVKGISLWGRCEIY